MAKRINSNLIFVLVFLFKGMTVVKRTRAAASSGLNSSFIPHDNGYTNNNIMGTKKTNK
ncbi:hypothetical protein [Treponema sp.]|uniref:hypothetical protein n=1 Tax=Treponema sp. TaxID=166 RepID=UPI003FA2CDEA